MSALWGSDISSSHRHHAALEHVLGTSLDLWCVAPDAEAAEKCQRSVLGEIHRLEQILSTYRKDSELARLNAQPLSGGKTYLISAELWAFLSTCTRWQARTEGALNVYMGNLIARWKQAAREGRVPGSAQIEGLVGELKGGGFRAVDRDGRKQIQLLGKGSFRVDAIAKGHILDRAVTSARKTTPGIRGILLNIGGDAVAWGRSTWAK